MSGTATRTGRRLTHPYISPKLHALGAGALVRSVVRAVRRRGALRARIRTLTRAGTDRACSGLRICLPRRAALCNPPVFVGSLGQTGSCNCVKHREEGQAGVRRRVQQHR